MKCSTSNYFEIKNVTFKECFDDVLCSGCTWHIHNTVHINVLIGQYSYTSLSTKTSLTLDTQ